jgi:hypothetical protein
LRKPGEYLLRKGRTDFFVKKNDKFVQSKDLMDNLAEDRTEARKLAEDTFPPPSSPHVRSWRSFSD